MLSIVFIFSLSLPYHVVKIQITGAVIVFPFSVALTLRKANFDSRNIGLK